VDVSPVLSGVREPRQAYEQTGDRGVEDERAGESAAEGIVADGEVRETDCGFVGHAEMDKAFPVQL
jgi:hypothetical protein